ncbi:MAG TPA: carbon monoxide dehydrogenase subunit G [Paraburkholderia sp.]|jgi:carbon monoxide dehydrogenase subunit G|nr:carbon monoxide dehydrogenase subunit G [Paraburkholderia sp.]
MKLADQYTLPAPPEAVWAALNDPAVLQATLPGCRSLTMLDERHFESTLQVRVGPAAATFRGQVELLDLEPPRAYTIVGHGNAGPAGFAKVTARVRLEAHGDASTALHYDADVEIGGKLMSVGARLIQSAAAKNLDGFFSALRAHVEQLSAGSAEGGSPGDESPTINESVLPASGDGLDAVRPVASARRSGPSSSEVAALQASGHGPSASPDWKSWAVGALSGIAGLVLGFLAGHLM